MNFNKVIVVHWLISSSQLCQVFVMAVSCFSSRISYALRFHVFLFCYTMWISKRKSMIDYLFRARSAHLSRKSAIVVYGSAFIGREEIWGRLLTSKVRIYIGDHRTWSFFFFLHKPRGSESVPNCSFVGGNETRWIVQAPNNWTMEETEKRASRRFKFTTKKEM